MYRVFFIIFLVRGTFLDFGGIDFFLGSRFTFVGLEEILYIDCGVRGKIM